jgi:HEAT repeats
MPSLPKKGDITFVLLVFLCMAVQTTFATKHPAHKHHKHVAHRHLAQKDPAKSQLAQKQTAQNKAVPEKQPAVVPQRAIPAQPAVPKVEWQNQRLTVTCVQASLKEVLRAVSAQTGFAVRGLENTQGQISADFEQLPLLDGLNILLRSYNYVAFGDLTLKSPDRPVIQVIGPIDAENASASGVPTISAHDNFSKDSSNSASARTTPPVAVALGRPAPGDAESLSVPPTAASKASGRDFTELVRTRQFSELETAAASGDKERLAHALSSPDPAIQARAFDLLTTLDSRAAGDALMTAIRQAPTAASRLQALQLLEGSRVPQADLVNALSTSAKDSDSEVRNFAILALGRHGGDLGLSVLSDLLRDSDPSIRLLVLQSAAQTNSGRVVISQAAEDSDPGVRNMATDLLNRISGQQ